MKPNIELNIGQLLLLGFSETDAFYIGRALKEELTRLIEQKGWPDSFSKSQDLRRMDAGKLSLNNTTDRPEIIGKKLAGNIYAGLSENK